MSQVARGPVVIDTGVFGAQLTRRTWPLGESYRPLVEGRAALVSFVTAAELCFGARLGGWGPQRLRMLERELERAETIWPGAELTDAYVALRYWCVRAGHALGQKHNGLIGGWRQRRSGWAFHWLPAMRSSPTSKA